MKKQIAIITLFLLFFAALNTVRAATATAVRIQAVIQNSRPIDPVTGGIPSSIYYTVVDENGRPLSDASIEEGSISITLDGIPQGTISSSIPDTPLFVATALDVSTSMQGYQEEMVTAVTQAINNAPESTRFGLLYFDHEIQLPQRFIADRHLLQDALRGITIPEERYTCLYDAANEATKSLAPIIAESPAIRRAIILFTDGENKPAPNTPCNYNDAEDVAEIIKFAQQNQIAIYTISFGNEADISLLETLAQETGGSAFTGEGSMEQKFSEVIRSLNSQRVAHTTLFPQTAAEHTLTLNLRVSGETQTSEAVESDSIIIKTEASPDKRATLLIKEHQYQLDNNQLIVTLEARNGTAVNCFLLKLRDMESKESIADLRICQPAEGRNDHILPVPRLVDGRSYRLEIDAEENICPTENNEDENNPCLRPFTVRLGRIPFNFEVESQPNAQQLLITLRELDTQTFSWVEYRATIFQEGATVQTFENVLTDPTKPFALPFYPESTSSNDDQATTYKIKITLWTSNAEGEMSQEVTVQLPKPPSIFARIGDGLNQRPFLSTLILILLITLPLLYFGRSWLEKRLPGTQFLWKQGVGSHSPSPIRPVTQLPEAVWTPPAPTPPTPPIKTACPREGVGAVSPPPTLQILASPQETAVTSIPITPLPFRIGRESCHLTIGDERTSRTHATIQRIGQQYFLTDLGSTNGTFLNDQTEPLTPNMRWPLTNGDHIRLGTTIELAFTLNENVDSE